MSVHRQKYPNSCGAACLMCAVIELGVNKIPARMDVHKSWETEISMNDANDGCETAIYAVTSAADYDTYPHKHSGYSLPSDIVKATIFLGKNATVYLPDNYFTKLLTEIYKEEMEKAEKEKVKIEKENAPELSHNQKLLKVMTDRSRNLHYVLMRSDKTIMDPDLGCDYPTFEKYQEKSGLYDTGIAILIE